MQLNLNVPLLTLNGKPMIEYGHRIIETGEQQVEGKKYGKDAEGNVYEITPLNLKAFHFAVHALNGVYPDEKLNEEDKLKRFTIIKKIHAATENYEQNQDAPLDLNLSTSEAAIIRLVASKKFDPWVLGQIVDIIEGT